MWSSPIPGSGTSEVSSLLKNIVNSEYGFKIGTTNPKFWTLKQSTLNSSKKAFQFQGPRTQSNFSINIDPFTKETSFDSYIKKSVKEYPYFGFKILKTTVMKLGGEPCYLVDLAHLKRNRQMRQFIVVKKEMAVVMTCVDEPSQFKETAVQCADLINNFQWTAPATIPL